MKTKTQLWIFYISLVLISMSIVFMSVVAILGKIYDWNLVVKVVYCGLLIEVLVFVFSGMLMQRGGCWFLKPNRYYVGDYSYISRSLPLPDCPNCKFDSLIWFKFLYRKETNIHGVKDGDYVKCGWCGKRYKFINGKGYCSYEETSAN